MGMFDYVECEYPLPVPVIEDGGGLQSKDGPCHLELIRITLEGRMLMKNLGDKWFDQDYHGYFEFYDSKTRYIAKFTDGQLVEIKTKAWEW
jgi:hypothetical protein